MYGKRGLCGPFLSPCMPAALMLTAYSDNISGVAPTVSRSDTLDTAQVRISQETAMPTKTAIERAKKDAREENRRLHRPANSCAR